MSRNTTTDDGRAENQNENRARLSIADTDAIEARLPGGWSYHSDRGTGASPCIRRDRSSLMFIVDETFPESTKARPATESPPPYRVLDRVGATSQTFDCENEAAAVGVAIELARLHDAERIVNTAPEYARADDRIGWLWAIGERREQLAAKNGEEP